jgi:hypothetical protein
VIGCLPLVAPCAETADPTSDVEEVADDADADADADDEVEEEASAGKARWRMFSKAFDSCVVLPVRRGVGCRVRTWDMRWLTRDIVYEVVFDPSMYVGRVDVVE